MHFELGDEDAARAIHEENLARARRLGDVRIVGTTLGALGEYDIRNGDLEAATPRLTEAYTIFRELGHTYEVAVHLVRFAWLSARAGRAALGARMLGRSLLVYEEIGAEIPAWVVPMLETCTAELRGQLPDEAYRAALEQGRHIPLDAVPDLMALVNN
jgi:hypothetical protein